MKLAQKQFEKLLHEDKLILSFIGMSNVGKTFWSKKLASCGFQHINCDDLVEIKLASKLKKIGYSGIKNVSRWMGQPYNKKFFKNQEKYLDFEREAMKNIFLSLKNRKRGNAVIDTTGSVVHLDKNIFSELKKHALVVYIKTTKTTREEMFRRYVKNPKPVVFGDIFVIKKGESRRHALQRCYLKLLNTRSRLYAKYSDIVISAEFLDRSMNAEEFISLIKTHCEVS